jgi:hypothetical protein
VGCFKICPLVELTNGEFTTSQLHTIYQNPQNWTLSHRGDADSTTASEWRAISFGGSGPSHPSSFLFVPANPVAAAVPERTAELRDGMNEDMQGNQNSVGVAFMKGCWWGGRSGGWKVQSTSISTVSPQNFDLYCYFKMNIEKPREIRSGILNPKISSSISDGRNNNIIIVAEGTDGS